MVHFGEVFVKSELTQKLADKSITKEVLYKEVEQDFRLHPRALEERRDFTRNTSPLSAGSKSLLAKYTILLT